MEQLIVKRIAGLITTQAGIRFREQDHDHLTKTLWQRCRLCGLRSLEQYYDLLVQELETAASRAQRPAAAIAAASEWSALFTQLTVNESYFFRDRNQFDLLVGTILPELIERKRQQHQQAGGIGLPRLRIWSAGCSTGEELYSIAIALQEMNFPWHEWQTLLVGTDISTRALSTARRGIYSDWSFRQTDPAVQNKYFRLRHQALQVREDMRQRVSFQYGNLISDRWPSAQSALREIDLIVCRNVFIYFNQAAIAHTLTKFHRTLAPDGYLITGHTELYGQDMSPFRLRVFPASLVYQRRPKSMPSLHQSPAALPPTSSSALAVPVPSPLRSGPPRHLTETVPPPQPSLTRVRSPALTPAPATPPADAVCPRLRAALAHLSNKAYGEAIREALSIQAEQPDQFTAHLILAKAYANTGQHERAKHWCQRALSLQPHHLELHYLLAQIAEEEHDLDAAKTHLRRIIYLDESQFQAYLDLASLYQRENRLDQAHKMQRLALKTLHQLPEQAIADAESGTTVAEWRQHLATQLAQ